VQFTFNRKRATQDPGVQLLRPGCSLLHWLRELADWDDRGRAFAMWRRAPEWQVPRIVIRACVAARLGDVVDGPDAIGRAALGRLVANWMGPWRYDVFLWSDGTPADEDVAARCRPAYDKQKDRNLGEERALVLPELVGATDWPALCRRWAVTAMDRAAGSTQLKETLAHAQNDARLWFAHQEARLRVRERQGADGTARDVEDLESRRIYVENLLEQPRLSVDSIGVYVLAAEAVR